MVIVSDADFSVEVKEPRRVRNGYPFCLLSLVLSSPSYGGIGHFIKPGIQSPESK